MSEGKTALVTGTTSGLGFETAAQLADAGYARVFITGRSQNRIDEARDRLVDRTGRNVFVPVVVDFDRLSTVDEALGALKDSGQVIDTAILNAGIAPPNKVAMNSDGFESTMASSLLGHHKLTMGLLAQGQLAANAGIVISGSEAARGDVPTFTPVDIPALAQSFDGNLEAAIEAQIRMTPPAKYQGAGQYATAKMFVAWWAAELARKLPQGMTINAVSPGATPETDAIRNAPFYMKYLMIPMFKILPGMSHSVADGASRYVDVATTADVTGEFFASKPKKMIGSIDVVELDHINNPDAHEALLNVVSTLTNSPYPANAMN